MAPNLAIERGHHLVGTSNQWVPVAIRSKWLIQDDAKIDVLIILTLPWRGVARKKSAQQRGKKRTKTTREQQKGLMIMIEND